MCRAFSASDATPQSCSSCWQDCRRYIGPPLSRPNSANCTALLSHGPSMLFVTFALLFLLKIGHDYSRAATVAFGIVGFVLLTAWHTIVANVVRSAVASGTIAGQRTLIIGDREELSHYPSIDLLRIYGMHEIGRFELGEDARDDSSRIGEPALQSAVEAAQRDRAEIVLSGIEMERHGPLQGCLRAPSGTAPTRVAAAGSVDPRGRCTAPRRDRLGCRRRGAAGPPRRFRAGRQTPARHCGWGSSTGPAHAPPHGGEHRNQSDLARACDLQTASNGLQRARIHNLQVPDDEGCRGWRHDPPSLPQRQPGHPDSVPCCGARASTNCRSS